jgi:hypothetical protein
MWDVSILIFFQDMLTNTTHETLIAVGQVLGWR